jgi:N-acetylated-alpha-linked acidic dipeptidase
MTPTPRRAIASLTLLLLTGGQMPAHGVDTPTAGPLLGFSAAGSAAQRELEAAVDAAIVPADARVWMERLTAHPHHVGSPWGKANAEWLRELFASWGYEARIERFDVLFPVPKLRRLEMTAPQRWIAKLAEPPVAGDATSKLTAEQLPTYNAYSADGDVTAELVYVNYGVPADYDLLAQHGIDVRGKIVLARYGGSWRGIKPKVAAEKGAIGCLIFSDPGGDGFTQGDVWPTGGWRSPWGVQRGSVADMPLYSGDPLTPGVGATPDAQRLDRSAAATLTKIPVLPISYADAQPLLAALGGPMAPADWRGNLPIPYRLGPGPTKVHLTLAFDWQLAPIYDVIATLPGAKEPDAWVLRGNHHDAWVNGATDPVSGLVALLSEARAIGQRVKAGWRPDRTIVFAAWDGEEPGLLGSTEWAETHGAELAAKAVAYINTDTIGRGFLGMEGSHTLERFANEAARDVVDPETQVSVLERARAAQIAGAGNAADRDEARQRADLRIGALGSGSDFTPFLQHLGIASLNVGFGGEGQYGQYHSIYDSFDHFVRFVDPDFAYVATAARLGARLVLRLANAAVLPLTVDRSAETIGRYAKEVAELAGKLRDESTERAKLLADHTLELTADPRETFVAPPALPAVPFLNFAPLDNAFARFTKAADAFETLRAALPTDGSDPRVAAVNAQLARFEQLLTAGSGLPGRPWYRHQIYAPGQYTGYGVKTLPAIREALELHDYAEAEAQVAVVAALLDQASETLEAAVAAGG